MGQPVGRLSRLSGRLFFYAKADAGTNVPFTREKSRLSIVCISKAAYTVPVIYIMTRQQVLDLYFLDARNKLIELAAFLDRVERADGKEDFRLKAFQAALEELSSDRKEKARNVLLAFSDPTSDPIPIATTKSACGAYPR